MTISPEFQEKTRKRIDELLDQKRFDEAATLAVHMAFCLIDPEELTKVLLNEIKKLKAEQHGR